jgi:hypothetical protein
MRPDRYYSIGMSGPSILMFDGRAPNVEEAIMECARRNDPPAGVYDASAQVGTGPISRFVVTVVDAVSLTIEPVPA